MSNTGTEAHGTSDQVAVSADGRFVAFSSDAPDLVSDDLNGKRDIFVRDNSGGAVTRVSVASDGTESNGDSSHPSISDDGRYVAFESTAGNLTSDDMNSGSDVFVRDRTLGTTVLVSPVVGAPSAAVARAAATGSSAPKAALPTPAPSAQRPAADGTVRVIVRARTQFTPSASLAPAARVQQQTDLAVGRDAVARAVQAHGGQVVRSIDGQPFVGARIPASNVAALRKDPSVSQVAYDEILKPTDVQSNALVGSPIANAAGIDGRGTAIAILDSGVDSTHPFLAGKVVAEGCFTSSATCPNGQNTQTGPGSAAPCAFEGCEHGTHVAGIAAGRRVTGGTYDGVAPAASIIAVEIFSLVPECSCIGAYSSDLIAGLQYVSSLRTTFPHIAAVNMSLGGGPRTGPCDDDPVKPAIDDLRAAGIATLIASGNEGATDGIDAPACISSAVAVGAVDDGDVYAPFSNSASNVALLAPGVAVESSIPGGGFESLTGTSMAVPNVSGVWALFKQLQPAAGVSGALAWLQATGRALRDVRNGVVTSRVCAAVAFGVGHCPDPAIPTPPANDDFANALALVGSSGTLTGSNANSGMEVGEPDHAGQISPSSVWYSFRPSVNGALSADTFGSSFDTVLALYSGNAVGSLTALASNDDAGGFQSAIGPVPLAAGTIYHLAVAGFLGETGSVSLSWRFQSALGDSTSPSISGDGRYVAFASDVPTLVAGDANQVADVFVRDLTARTTTRVSVAANGTAGDGPSMHPAISGDGSRIAFASAAANLVTGDGNAKVDVFVRSRTDATSIKKVSAASNGVAANGLSDRPALDRTGGNVAFESDATNIVAGDGNHVRDVFLFTIASGLSQRVSVAGTGGDSNGPSSGASVSADGRFVAFTSGASNLVTGDTKSFDDVFVRDRTGGTNRRVSSAIDDTEAGGPSSGAAITRDGNYVGFASTATNLVGGDGNGASDVFLRRRQPVTITSVAPGTAQRGQTLVFVIQGSSFLVGAQVSIPDAVVTAVMVTSSTQISVAVQVPLNVPVGNRNVVVQEPGASWDPSTGANAICVNCVRLT
ncbi:MAG: S8 family serine peptidase [Acidimicrobiia bacterium]